jgi:penicillin-binding protein A
MYALLDLRSRRQISLGRFVRAYRAAAAIATLTAIVPKRAGPLHGNVVSVAVLARTRLFGSLHETIELPVSSTGPGEGVEFSPALTFPGLRAGERLTRRVALGRRGALLADDGTPLAQGPRRSSPIPDVAGQIVGSLGPIPAAAAAHYAAQGYPRNARVGVDGLERIFQLRLAGRPGGTLRAGHRLLAHTAPTPGATVRTTIDPGLERAMLTAMGGRYAGMVALDPRTGAVLAAAGLAFSPAQPPGSTMKIITATGALEAGVTRITETFPFASSATIEGFALQNDNGESCGGTLLAAFAASCNSVFAPLGAKLGAARLVQMATRFGFDQPPLIPGAAVSLIPSAARIGDALAVASSAIGQGRVQATTLEMTDAAATIAMRGRRPLPTLLAGAPPRFVAVTSPRVASLVARMMVAVVSAGTGTAAQIPGVSVAGKTGTAQVRAPSSTPDSGSSAGASAPGSDSDAWFVGYAPAEAPRIVVGALFPGQGAGGATAAPAVQPVLVAGLHATASATAP